MSNNKRYLSKKIHKKKHTNRGKKTGGLNAVTQVASLMRAGSIVQEENKLVP